MQLSDPLDEILRSRTHIRVLRALDGGPVDFGLSGREVARRAGVTHPSAAKALHVLREQGLVLVERSPRSDEFRLNAEHLLAGAVRALFESEQGILNDLRDTLRSRLVHLGVRRAFLFGSVIRSAAGARSDIDLALEPPAGEAAEFASGLDRLRGAVRARFGNELSVMVKPARASRRQEALWRRLARDSVPIFDGPP